MIPDLGLANVTKWTVRAKHQEVVGSNPTIPTLFFILDSYEFPVLFYFIRRSHERNHFV